MGKLIIGNNNTSTGVTDIVALGVSDRDFTSADEGKIFLGDNVEIDENGILQGPTSPTYTSEVAGFATTALKKVYFVDCSSLSITATITTDLNEYVFVKTDATANTLDLTPDSGLINGAASFSLTAQYQKVTVVYDGTNYYV